MLLLGIAMERWLWAAALVFAYLGLCAVCLRMTRKRAAWPLPAATGWTVVFASQSGLAEALARQTARALELSGAAVRCLTLDQIDGPSLAAGGRLLFVVSTAGEGDAPDNGASFAREVLGAALDLSAVDFGLLALGDRDYRHFCAFGRRLEAWLVAQGACRAFDVVEVDRGDPAAIAAWQAQLARLAGAGEFAIGERDGQAWRLVERRHLNPGSPGGAVFHLAFAPLSGALPDWEAGDLARIVAPADPLRPRLYSLASIPAEGRLCLLVRRAHQADGSLGRVSGWLSEGLQLGQTLYLGRQRNAAFHLGENAGRPAIFIGNGVGLAGLRAHLRARIDDDQHDNWLIFGERQRTCDFHYEAELRSWLADGKLRRLDTVFSRDGEVQRYVQDCLSAAGAEFRHQIGRGAAVYVCGSRDGMAEAVDRVIRALLGGDGYACLVTAGRYRRDVF